jgi:hypothetical protein
MLHGFEPMVYIVSVAELNAGLLVIKKNCHFQIDSKRARIQALTRNFVWSVSNIFLYGTFSGQKKLANFAKYTPLRKFSSRSVLDGSSSRIQDSIHLQGSVLKINFLAADE